MSAYSCRWTIPVIIIALMLPGALCFSQGSGSISGRLAFEDGSPVAFAYISIIKLKKYASSDGDGHFEILNVPDGLHEIEITSLEAVKAVLNVQTNSSQLKIVLKRAEASVLNEVVVQGDTEKREIETKGFAASVIDTKEMSLRNFQTNELLDRTAGVRVRQNGGMGAAVDYNLNGMSGNSVRIFIDGIAISTYGASFSLNSIPPALIERIEVYKGVIPAHLADDALGGAINVVLKKSMQNNLTASASYGSFNTQQANLSSMFRDKNSGFTVKASGFYNYADNDYEVSGKFVRNILANGRYDYVTAKRFNDAYRSAGGQVELGFTDVKWADQFFVGYNGSADYNEIQHGTYMSIPYKGRFTESEAHVGSLTYRKTNFLAKGVELLFTGMYSDRSQVVNDTVKWNYNWYGEKSIGLQGDPILRPQGAQQGAPTINHVDRSITTFRAGVNYDLHANHRLVFSHSFFDIDRSERDDMRSLVEREFVGTRDLQKNISSLAYEMKAFDARLKTNLFAKYYQQKISKMDPVLVQQNGEAVRSENRVSSEKETTGYGIAVSYGVMHHLVLLMSAEKAVRMPSENEVFGSPGDNISENVNINAEISNNLNIGFRAGTYSRNVHKFSVSGTGFIRDTRDKIVQRINPRLNDAIQTNPYENLGKTKSIGFEAEVAYTYKNRFNVMINTSKFNSVFNTKLDPNGNVYSYYKQQLPNEPFFTINSTVQYTLSNLIVENSLLNLYYSFGYVDRFYTMWMEIEEFRTPRQHVQDVGISYVFPDKKFVISADAKNIFDNRLYDNFAVLKPGRAFYLKLNYMINNF